MGLPIGLFYFACTILAVRMELRPQAAFYLVSSDPVPGHQDHLP
jgi:hypothetical protein